MKHVKTLIQCLLILVSAVMVSCAGGPVSGLLYSDVMGPVNATGTMRGPLHGEACAASYLGLVAMGDASISAAAKAGSVNQISHVEHSFTSILGLYSKYCTIVYGSKGGMMTNSVPVKVPAPGTQQPAIQPTTPGM